MQWVFETERCYLRRFELSDAAAAYELNADPDVIRYTGDGPFESVEAARIFLENYKPYVTTRMGRWAVIRKSDDAFLGWCGLKLLEETQEVDLGYRFHKKYWNMGYATETALAALHFGFHTLALQEIIGRAETENAASIRVLQKCGLKFLKDTSFDGKPGVVYLIKKEAFCI